MNACAHACACSTPAPARRRLGPALLVALLLTGTLTTGTAYAFWAATASGAATAQSASAVALGVSATSTPTASLYPGRTEDLAVRLSNPNPYPVSLTTLTAASVSSSDPVACPATSITLPAAVTTALLTGGYTLPTPLGVPAGATGTAASLSGFLTMATTAPDGCQGRTFTVTLAFSGSQA